MVFDKFENFYKMVGFLLFICFEHLTTVIFGPLLFDYNFIVSSM